jgi:uncharacterized membrane protein
MGKGRLEAFSDGVIAIIITIMVLELKVPHGADFAALRPLIPVFLSYVLSFVFLAIYWNNHHHLLQTARQVNGRILWANVHLLFWLSLIPFVTAWMGENHFAALPVALYGVVMLFSALAKPIGTIIAYTILSVSLVAYHGKDSPLAIAMGRDYKGKISLMLYTLAIPLAFVNSWLAGGMYATVSMIWLIPDRRIEKTFIS